MYVGLLALGLLSFCQPFGLIAADTKHDLVANPWGFLASATSAWTDVFTFGQLQNQAYGYLFPQGLFFALAEPLPDWIAQRLWWWLVLGVGYSGMLLLLRQLRIVGIFAAVAAFLYALSPRTLSTLTTISSETWPIMLAPWVLWPLMATRIRFANLSASVLAVAAMGAVNATATLAACVPAGLLLGWRLIFDRSHNIPHRLGSLFGWTLGCMLVSLWWIGPLLVLGTYASPFTDFIENATVTTRWLNLAEILRGTTSWSPFVDAERQAGRLLVTNPVMIIATLLVATLGLLGMGKKSLPLKSYWLALFGLGLIILGGASSVTDFLDGPGTALRNIHKFDLLLRLPLMVGVAVIGENIYPGRSDKHLGSNHSDAQLASADQSPIPNQQETAAYQHVGAAGKATVASRVFSACQSQISRFFSGIRQVGATNDPTATKASLITSGTSDTLSVDRNQRKLVAATGIILIALAAVSPAWSFRLLPLGSYEQVPEYWHQAADYLNEHASDTRTLILPQSSFARQTWGWTRDEPAQPLLSVPWAVRDAIPLVDPETIRGLDGLSSYPTAANLLRHGIGAVIIRHDLMGDNSLYSAERLFPGYPTQRFKEVEVVLLSAGQETTTTPSQNMYLVDESEVVSVAGGGESLAFLANGTYRLVPQDAEIVTDTPLLAARNYGTVDSITAPLAGFFEAIDVHNPVMDYPSVGPRTKVETAGATITASSSASDATSFHGANPARSVTAAIDGNAQTAWYPRPGRQNGEWLELHVPAGSQVEKPVLEVTLASARAAAKTPRVEVTVTSGQSHFSTFITAGKPTKIPVPGGSTTAVRLALGASGTPVGVSEISLLGVPASRVVTVPSTSPHAREFVFNQVFANTSVLQRRFFVPESLALKLQLSSCVQSVTVDDKNFKCGDTIHLDPGWHDISTKARVVWLKDQGFSGEGAVNEPLPTHIASASHTRLVVTNRSTNHGLRGYVGDTALSPTIVNAGIQAFVVPPGVAGSFRMEFAGDKPFRLGLFAGAGVGIIAAIVCGWGVGRRKAGTGLVAVDGNFAAGLIVAAGLYATVGWPALVAGVCCFVVVRHTLFSWRMLVAAGMGMALMWLPRAPWPALNYAGDSVLLSIACTMAVWGMLLSSQGRKSNS